MEQTPVALLLAGGFATRLWPLTEKRAKPLLPLAGKSLIRHIIDKLPSDMEVIISTNQQFEEAFLELEKAYPERKMRVFIEDSASDKTKKGALAATSLVIDAFQLNNPLLLIAGDNYFGFDIQDFLSSYSGKTLLASYDTKSLQAARQFGVLTVDGNRLSSFVEKPQDPGSTLISTGCYLFAPEHLPEIQAYAAIAADNLGGIFEHLLDQQAEIKVFPFEEEWIDIGSFESYLDAHRSLMKEHQIAPSSQLTDCELGEAVFVGENCVIENSHLDHVMIMDGSTIRNARIRGSIVDEGCSIEGVDLDHKMIRAGSTLSPQKRVKKPFWKR